MNQLINSKPIYIGTAGWAQRKEQAHLFLTEGSHLERYASVYNCVEINSAFYRNHMGRSYKRWAEAVPQGFLFSVKLSKIYTHEHKLKVADDHLQKILSDIAELGSKLGVLLVQLPPSLKFDTSTAERFFTKVNSWFPAGVVVEPRHTTWSSEEALRFLSDLNVSVVHADPDLIGLPNRYRQKINYLRLHGTPQIYKSSYTAAFLNQTYSNLLDMQSKKTQQNWVVFDNTTYGYATENAFELQNICSQFKPPELTL